MYKEKATDKKIAFVLSGGGSRGAYEIGVWQALRELGIRIDIVTGTSVGALNGAAVTQGLLSEATSLWYNLETSMIFDIKNEDKQISWSGKNTEKILPKLDLKLDFAGMALDDLSAYAKEIIRNGGTEYTSLKRLLEKHLDETAIRQSPIDFGIVTVELGTMKPRFLFKSDIPEGKLIDYMLASAACFPALKSYEIDNVKYIDGAYSDNLPIGMALEKGATHVIAVNLDSIGMIDKKKIAEANYLKMIQCSWDLGNILVFEPNSAKHLIRLGYLDGMKAFEAYDGRAYCFIKGQMDKRRLPSAESAGRVFDLDPELIYSKESFNEKLQEAFQLYAVDMDTEIKKLVSDLSKKRFFFMPNLFKRLNAKTITVAIVHNTLQGDKVKNVFAGKAASKLFKQESEAAGYIIRAGLYFPAY